MVVGEFAMDADVVIIGGGPAGYACAEAAARGGRTVTVIDSSDPNAIDSTTARHMLLRALLATNMAAEFRLIPDTLQPDLSMIMPMVAAAQQQSIEHREQLIATLNLTRIHGTARFLSGREVQVAGDHVHRLRFKRAVICTGSTRSPHSSLDGFDGVISAEHLVTHPEVIAGSVTVLGNSPVAVETASIASGLGATVTLVTGASQLLPGIPDELTELLCQSLPYNVHIGDFSEANAAPVIVDATHRIGRTDALGLSTTSVQQVDCWIETDDRMQTGDARVLAAGDCTGSPLHAGAAAQQGRIAAETIIGGHAAWDPTAIAQVCHTSPQICWAGHQKGDHVQTIVSPWAGPATSNERTVLSWDASTSTLTGVGAIGPGACDLADGFVTTLEMGTTLQDLADMVPTHVSGHCVLGDAARNAMRQA